MRGFLVLAIFSLSYGFYGHITKDTVWRDTVLITGDVVVDSGVCLEIEPGTVVRFDTLSEWDYEGGRGGVCGLFINGGSIKAVGTSLQRISFISIKEEVENRWKRWEGIKIINGVECIFFYTIIKYTLSDAIYINGLQSHICRIEGNVIEYVTPIYQDGCGINCALKNVDTVIIKKNIIRNNIAGDQGINAGGISCSSKEICKVEENVIENCAGGPGNVALDIPSGSAWGIDINTRKAVIINNYIKGIGGGGGYTDSPGMASGISCSAENGIIEGNKVLCCWGGGSFPPEDVCGIGKGLSIYPEGMGDFTIKNNKIENWSTYGILLYAKTFANIKIGGSLEEQNDIYNAQYDPNQYCIYNLTPNDIIATYNYWGSTNPDTIAEYIFDKEDSTDLGRVIYEPWAEESLGIDERIRNKEKRIRLIAYPNPFREKIEIRWEMSKEASEPIRIYDISGRIVKSFASVQSPESKAYKVTWYGRDDKGKKLPSGIYFIKAEKEIEKVILLRGDND